MFLYLCSSKLTNFELSTTKITINVSTLHVMCQVTKIIVVQIILRSLNSKTITETISRFWQILHRITHITQYFLGCNNDVYFGNSDNPVEVMRRLQRILFPNRLAPMLVYRKRISVPRSDLTLPYACPSFSLRRSYFDAVKINLNLIIKFAISLSQR